MNEFRDLAKGLDAESLASALGVPKDIISSFGLDDLSSIFANPPPGIDVIVALTKIFKYAGEKDERAGELGTTRSSSIRPSTDTPYGYSTTYIFRKSHRSTDKISWQNSRAQLRHLRVCLAEQKTKEGPKTEIGGILGRLEDLQENMASPEKDTYG